MGAMTFDEVKILVEKFKNHLETSRVLYQEVLAALTIAAMPEAERHQWIRLRKQTGEAAQVGLEAFDHTPTQEEFPPPGNLFCPTCGSRMVRRKGTLYCLSCRG